MAGMGSPFGSPASWRHDDLIGVSREFDADLALAAYAAGVFPMPAPARLMGWYSPLRRGVLPLDGLRVTRSLRKMLPRYEIRVDTAFGEVLAACADRRRPHGWIDRRIRKVYTELHQRGIVHSVEAWSADGELAGGLYGVSLGGLFAGESMFHRPDIGRDASKAALVALVDFLVAMDPTDRLLDVQWVTPHLASLGVVEIAREDYLELLAQALRRPAPDWRAVR
jgi:leucyl/phenylalanyl-tRNA---protein transferase